MPGETLNCEARARAAGIGSPWPRLRSRLLDISVERGLEGVEAFRECTHCQRSRI